MSEPIFLKNGNGKLIPLNETPYEKEEDLQIMLAQNPELIYSVNDKIAKLLLIKQEAGIPGDEGESDSFSLDHIFVDPEGRLTFVEVKRSTDTRIRREVIGQMFDYAAHARAFWTLDKIREMFKSTWNERALDPASILQSFIGEERDQNQFWELVMTNLKAGNVRMLFVADTIPKRLQLIIEYLNDFMDPCEVLALEVRQFLGKDQLQMIAPHYVGRSVQADVRKNVSGKGERWTSEQFMDTLSRNTSTDIAIVAKKIHDWAISEGIHIEFGFGSEDGSMFLMATKDKKDLVTLTLVSTGVVRVDFRWLKTYPPFTNIDNRIALIRKLNDIAGVNISEDLVNGYPRFPISVLKESTNYQKFIQIMKWVVQELQSV